MQVVSSISALRSLIGQWKNDGNSVGFVPTMGNLHDGHLSLVKQAKDNTQKVIVSIFVNPMQFGENEDLDAYPRTLDQDKAKLTDVGADAVFLPSVEDMYPGGLKQQTFVEVPDISHVLCGASRPGHFRGVATVVTKLFNMVQPDAAFFGEKDFQQLQVIRTMVQDLSMPIAIHGVPTAREDSGLAMSSRNGYLSKEERLVAPELFAAMSGLGESLKKGEYLFTELAQNTARRLNEAGFVTDYVKIVNTKTLQPAVVGDKSVVILVAAYLGTTRLIDNLPVVL
ncbi:pantoate--beta-alanine ligase [Alteromonas sp. KUL49]|uniref:pantoate--beta-alanine ligase n=1 Tax=Alteromonas sp. KUL49 TaxID=2480798 RepID=UPI00102F0458|nr:pantoate--beta-alanine ligase [Alteromonas sp. KUL49]TAP37984.1 pantoate--beta-alanine ligase [Alteromonas sp. KUL49]GEA12857.1 pantothenate synthetase [Alteromonas sp. KUL49]